MEGGHWTTLKVLRNQKVKCSTSQVCMNGFANTSPSPSSRGRSIPVFEPPLFEPPLFEFDAPAGSFQNSNSTVCDCRIPFSGILAQSGQKSTCTRLEHGGQWFHSDSVVTSIRAEGADVVQTTECTSVLFSKDTTSQTWVTRDEALKQQCLNVGNVLIVECSC